jgi:hypothetical protein
MCFSFSPQTQEQCHESSLVYTAGRFLPRESGSASIQDRTVEYKSLTERTIDSKSVNYIEEPLVKKYGVFAVSCLNERVNGTFCCGVNDAIRDEFHGTIRGIRIPHEKRYIIEEIFEKHFVGPHPQQFQNASPEVLCAIRKCLKPPVFVPIVNDDGGEQDDDLVVIEFDVEPTASVCGSITFCREVKQKGVKNFTQSYYIRKGTSSDPWTRSISDLEEVVKKNAEWRLGQEELLRGQGTTPNVERLLTRSFCRGQSRINDRDSEFVLVIGDITGTKITKYLADWLPHIRWSFVLDFNPRSEVFGAVQSKFSSAAPVYLTIDDAQDMFQQDMTNGEFRKRAGDGDRIPWLSGVEEEIATPKDWLRKTKSKLMKSFAAFTEETDLTLSREKVFCFLVEGQSKMNECLTFLLPDVSSIIDRSSQLFVVTSDESVQESMQRELKKVSPDDCSHSLCLKICSHNYLRTKMLKMIDTDLDTGCIIPSSSGKSGVVIPSHTLEKFRRANLNVLTTNPNFKEEDQTENDAVSDYLKGAGPTWDIFHSSAVVERSLVQDIRADISHLSIQKCEGVESRVKVKRIWHERGSGASTAAMHAAHTLREEYRCASIDGNVILDAHDKGAAMKKLVKQIALLRLYDERKANNGSDAQQSDNLCKLLLVLDNATDGIAAMLRRDLATHINDDGHITRTTQVVLVYLTCTGDSIQDTCHHTPTTIFRQCLNKDEKSAFASKRERRLKQYSSESILGFLSFADNFETNEYVEQMVDSLIRHIDNRQLKLLLFLSLFGKYGREGYCAMSETHCKIVLGIHENKKPLMELLHQDVGALIICFQGCN